MRRREGWLIAGALALLVSWGAGRGRGSVLTGGETSGASSPYAECGEVLLHGYSPTRSPCPSLYMPVAGLTAARLLAHARRLPWRELALAAGLLSVAALCVLAGASRAAPGALLILLLWPELWPRHQSYVQFFYTLFVLPVAGALVWRESKPTPARTAVFALAVGASVLFRSPLAFLPPLLAALELSRRSRDRRLNMAILLIVPYLLLIPWAAMNKVVYGQWSLFERGESLPNIVTAALGRVFFVDQEWRAAVRAHPLLQTQNLLWCLRWAFEEIARHPLRYLEGAAGRLGYALSLKPWLFVAAAAGFWLHRGKAAVRVLGAACAYFLLLHCSIAVLENYFVPLWPLLACLAAMLGCPRGAWAPPAARPAALARGWLLICVGALVLAGLEAQSHVVRYAVLARERAPDSERSLDEALARDPGDGWLNYQDGWRRLRSGDAAGAEAAWSRAVAVSPANLHWALHHAWAAALTGRPESLLSWNAEAPPWSSEGQRADPDLLKAHALLRAGRAREARERLAAAYAERVRRSHGNDRELLSLEILWDRSRELFGAMPPRDWLGLWSELRGFSKRPGGLGVVRRCDPMRDEVIALQNAGNPREAISLLRVLLEKRPDAADLWTDKAVNETFVGSWETAASDLRRAIAADSSYWPAYLSLGAVYVKLGRPAEARKVYDRAIEAGKNAADPVLDLIRRN
ncbi:MAG: tetratricopeptide repeat protein [Elusimicrobia bacterium]|nr:tetratricopeptide repeat protein [Elusimicrobiota bacterium]